MKTSDRAKETATPRRRTSNPATRKRIAEPAPAEQGQAALHAGEELAARVDHLVTRLEQSLAASEASQASLRAVIDSREGSLSLWQATLASAEESLKVLQGALARGRDSLVAWQATVDRGEASVAKAEAQFTHALQLLRNGQEDLTRLQAEFAGELTSGRDALTKWNDTLTGGMSDAVQWKRSIGEWQQSVATWSESSARLLANFAKLVEAESARQARRPRVHPVLIALLLAGMLLVGVVAGYNGAQEFLGRPEIGGGATAPAAVEVPVAPFAAPPDSAQPPSPAPATPTEAAPTDQQGPAGPVPAVVVVYRAQVGAYRQRDNAEALLRRLSAGGFDAVVHLQDGLYRVQVGEYQNRAEADRTAQALRSQGYADVFVIQEESGAAP